MAERELIVQFRREPLRFLDQEIPLADAFRLPQGELCLADASAARAVLANADELYEEHSDFFHTRRGVFGPRSVQLRIGRPARALLRAYLSAHAAELPGAVQRSLEPASEWPDAGNWLVYRHLAPALIAPDNPARLLRAMDEIVEHASWQERGNAAPVCAERCSATASCAS